MIQRYFRHLQSLFAQDPYNPETKALINKNVLESIKMSKDIDYINNMSIALSLFNTWTH